MQLFCPQKNKNKTFLDSKIKHSQCSQGWLDFLQKHCSIQYFYPWRKEYESSKTKMKSGREICGQALQESLEVSGVNTG